MHRLIALALLLPLAASAVPVQLTHQGRLLDAAGGPINGAQTIAIGLYASLEATEPVWSESFAQTRLDDGYFSLTLGSDEAGNPLDHTLLDQAGFVGVRVDALELGTRQRLTSVPRAAQAEVAGHADTAELAEEALHALEADSAATADLAEEALHALEADTADSAGTADLAEEALHALEADTANSAGTADLADEALHALDADTADVAAALSGVSTATIATAGTYGITTHSCAWSACTDAPSATSCPASHQVVTRVAISEMHGDQAPCGNLDDYRVYCCSLRVVVPGR